MEEAEVKQRLCWYDTRHPDFVPQDEDVFGHYRQPYCLCDNCMYGRSRMAEEILSLRERILLLESKQSG